MQLDRLLDGVEVIGRRGDPANTEISAVTHDSRQVNAGALFCCVPGEHLDGHAFAADAVAAGAVALLCERELPIEVTQVVTPHVRPAMAVVADAFWGHPSRHLQLAGVTGTNGKTTTTHLIRSIMDAAGRPCGLIGTLSGARTTPESTELQAQLAQFRQQGRAAVAMEVSSHALAMHRVDATWFSVVVFTNLGRDHLDFHETEEAYFRAKAALFEPDRAAVAVVNADDAHGRLLLDAARLRTHPYTLADATDVEIGIRESEFSWRGVRVRLGLGGWFNVSNALAAATAAAELGVDEATIAEGLSTAPGVSGRFEPVDVDLEFSVVVDYAHTPDALEQVLKEARRLVGGHRVSVVFGCGGERDHSKRPLMGEIAERLADLVFITSDNPRGEDPLRIIDEVLAGIRDRNRPVVEPDRRRAIESAMYGARPGDIVVIAGKGHETTQVIGQRVLPFDDREVVRDVARSIG